MAAAASPSSWDVLVDQVGARPRRVQAHDRGQRLVVDDDALGRVLGHVAVDRHHHGDGLADVVHLAPGQGVLGAGVREVGVGDQERQRVGQPPGQVVPRVHADQAVDLEGAGHVDPRDAGVGVGAAHERGGQRAVAGVVEEPPGAPHQALVLAALDPLAEPLGGHGSPASSAARRTDRTMFT
jgi:hypothetical protein